MMLTNRRFLGFVVAGGCLVVSSYARCAAPLPVQEAYNADYTAIVARLSLTERVADASCSYRVAWEGNVIRNDFFVYKVEEVFKGTLEEELPVIYWTDTGYRRDMPSYLTESTEGFLAFLGSDCQSPSDWTEPNPDGPVPFSVSECSSSSPWSDVSEEDKSFLRSKSLNNTSEMESSNSTLVDPPQNNTSLPPTPSPTIQTEQPTGNKTVGPSYSPTLPNTSQTENETLVPTSSPSFSTDLPTGNDTNLLSSVEVPGNGLVFPAILALLMMGRQ